MKMKDVYKIAVSIPSQGHIPVDAYDNHLIHSFNVGKLQEKWKQEKRKPRYDFYWFTVGKILTPMAREKLAQVAVEENLDYILMYDDDMLLPMNMVEEMIYDFEKNPEIDILAPLAFMRGSPNYPVIYSVEKGWDENEHREYFINRFVKSYPKNKLIECDAVGFGAVMIKVELLKKMKEPYFFSTTGAGEDVYFCHKAKEEANAGVFMDTRIKLGHLGHQLIIDEEFYEKMREDKGKMETLGKPKIKVKNGK